MEIRDGDIENRSKYEPGYRKEKLESENGPKAGFKGIQSGTENNAAGMTRVEVGEPKGNRAAQMRAMDRSGDMTTSRFPVKGLNPTKDKSPYEKGETKNTYKPKHGR